MVRNCPVTVMVQNRAYLAQIVKEGLDYAIEILGMRILEETLQQSRMVGHINTTNSLELGALMGQTFLTLPLFPFYPYLPNS